MTRFLVDTNVLIRFTVRDDPAQAARADRLFQQAADGDCVLVLTHVVIVEAVWVLSTVYIQPRDRIADKLAALIGMAGIQCDSESVMLHALDHYRRTRLDIVDCLLAAASTASGDIVATFDQALRKLPDMRSWADAGSNE